MTGTITGLKYSVLILAAGFVFSLTLQADSVSSSAYMLINQGLFVTLSCFLLLPGKNTPVNLVLNSALPLLLFIILSQLVEGSVAVTVLFKTGIIIVCLSLLLWSLWQLLDAAFPHRASIIILVTFMAAMMTSSPVWLAPVVDLYQPGDTIINTIIAVTPLTHFSVASEYDFLRSEWMYRNTPFGSLLFSYPGFTLITTGYLVCIILLQLLNGWIKRPGLNFSTLYRQSFSLS